MQPGGDTSDEGLREWVAQAEAKAERYQALRAGVAEVSATGHSDDGIATATVDAAGNLADLHITDEVRRLSGERAAAAVMGAVRRAQSRLAGQVAEVVSSTVGDDDSTMDTVLSSYHAKFPEPDDEDEPPRDDGDYIRPESLDD